MELRGHSRVNSEDNMSETCTVVGIMSLSAQHPAAEQVPEPGRYLRQTYQAVINFSARNTDKAALKDTGNRFSKSEGRLYLVNEG